MTLRIDRLPTGMLTSAVWSALIPLCDAAFHEDTGPYFAAIGPGEHLLTWSGSTLVSHLMWVPRWLQPAGHPPMRTAYVEMVATAGPHRGRGHATRLLEMFPPLVVDFELAALSPATEGLYQRLGWRYWRGPLSTRRDDRITPDPEERVMLLPLPRTPSDLDWDSGLSVEWRAGEVW